MRVRRFFHGLIVFVFVFGFVSFVRAQDSLPILYDGPAATEDNWDLLDLLPDELMFYYSTDIWLNTVFGLSFVHLGTPYLWGGDSWDGIDCSHFTRKVYDLAGYAYHDFLTTQELKQITQANGLVAVDKQAMQKGDLLVYGYEDQAGWHGHVVILVDSNYTSHSFRGLLLGAHGKVGFC